MAFTYRYNPLSKTFDIVQDSSLLTLKGTVDTNNDLPLTENSENDLYVVKDGDRLFTWNKATSSGILADWIDVGSVASIDWSIINNKPTSGVGDIDDAVTKKHTQNTDTILTTDGATALLNAGSLKINLLSDDGVNIQIDEIRARDGDGLKLFDDGDNGIFVEDGGRVLIGATSGFGNLHIEESTAGTSAQLILRHADNTNANSGAFLNLVTIDSTGGDPSIVFSISNVNDWSMGVDNSDSDKFKIGTLSILGGANRFTIERDGNIGIGTTSPARPLHIQDTGFAELQFTSDSGGTPRDWHIGVGTGDGRFSITETDVDERVTILEGGNFGIGTISPDTKLEVAGQVKITGGVPGTGKVLTSDASGLATWETPSASGWTDDGTVVRLTTITDSVGIGTSTPNASSILDLFSTTKGFLLPRMTATQRDAISTPEQGLMLYDTTNDKLDFFNNTVWRALVSTNASTLTPGGIVFATEGHHIEDDPAQLHWDSINNRMGIGTNIPTVPLDVVGDVNTSTDYNVAGSQVLSSTTLGSGIVNSSLTNLGTLSNLTMSGTSLLTFLQGGKIKFSGGSGNNFIEGNVSNTGRLGTFTDNVERITILLSGEVGIGDVTPDGKLEVRQTGTGDIFNLYDGGTNVLTVLDGGNVGIGETDPETILHISQASPTIRMRANINNDASLELVEDLSGTDNGIVLRYLGSSSNNRFSISTLSPLLTERLSILRDNGFVGIGVTDPDARLEVNGQVKITGGTLVIEKTDSGQVAEVGNAIIRNRGTNDWAIKHKLFTDAIDDNVGFGHNTGGKITIGATLDNSIDFLTGDGVIAPTLKMSILGNGNIGIGASSPTNSTLLELSSTTGALLITRLTTTQKNALTAINGMIIYDSTLNKFQGRENGAWTNLI